MTLSFSWFIWESIALWIVNPHENLQGSVSLSVLEFCTFVCHWFMLLWNNLESRLCKTFLTENWRVLQYAVTGHTLLVVPISILGLLLHNLYCCVCVSVSLSVCLWHVFVLDCFCMWHLHALLILQRCFAKVSLLGI